MRDIYLDSMLVEVVVSREVQLLVLGGNKKKNKDKSSLMIISLNSLNSDKKQIPVPSEL